MINRDLFSTRIKQLRNERNLTMTDISNTLNIKMQSVQKWENKLNIPSADNIYALAELFGVSIDYLCGRTERREMNK